MQMGSPRSYKTGAGVGQKIRFVPLVAVGLYLLLTYLLFLFGPYEWPLRAAWVPYIYVPCVFILIILGFMLSTAKPGTGRPLTWGDKAFYIGAIGTLVLLTPFAKIYTDKYPWQVLSALADQKAAYSGLADQLAATEGTRGPISLLHALIAPFAFCVLPFAVMHWDRMDTRKKFLAFCVVLASIDLSILRGTTRELADIVIIGGSAFLARLGRNAIESGYQLIGALARHWKLLILTPLLLLTVVGALIGRAEARLGGQNAVCIGSSGACVSSAPPYSTMGDTALFGSAMITAYLSQGYYGLSLAGEKPFRSTYGVGHSPALSALYVAAGGDPALLDRAYTARARLDGWDDIAQWSGLLTWIANDIGLPGAAGFAFLLACFWGRAWMNAIQGDDRAVVFFCVTMEIFFYLPANNQMMLTYDGYFTLLFWGFAANVPFAWFKR